MEADSDMRLPINKHCSDCKLFEHCKRAISISGNEVSCDWSPSRFAESNASILKNLHTDLAKSIGETINAVGVITQLRSELSLWQSMVVKDRDDRRVSEAQLRSDNERLEKAYQLAVAECVKALGERDMHKRNWTNTMAHRDRLGAELDRQTNVNKTIAADVQKGAKEGYEIVIAQLRSGIAEYAQARQDLIDFDIEDYIQSLPWSDEATDYEKTLVAGNLRRLYFKLTNSDSPIFDSEPVTK